MLAFVIRLGIALCVAGALFGAANASAALPGGFVGVLVDGPMLTADVDGGRELGVMQRSGVQSVRFSIYWNELRPYAKASEVPAEEAASFPLVEGVPTNFGPLDVFVAAASERGFDLLPVVLRAPAWARRNPLYPHSSPTAAGRKAYAAFLTALVHRYGPDGTFWAAHPDLDPRPIERWQVWNEPNGPAFWHEQPGIAAYVKLLRQASKAIHDADADAQVVLAGLFGKAWQPLRQIYARGGGGLFDVAAVNPFTYRVANVMKIIRQSRQVMNANGDEDVPLLATELSWPTAKDKTKYPYGFEVTEKGQAQRVKSVLNQIGKAREALGLSGFFWSSWISYDRDKSSSFDYAGLRRADGAGKVIAKPGFFAFKRAVAKLSR
jgi:hypothetical protein